MTFGYVLVPSDFIILINEQYIKVFIDYSRLDCHMFYLIIMSFHNRICNKSNLTSATCGVEIFTRLENLSSSPLFSGVRVAQSYSFLCNTL